MTGQRKLKIIGELQKQGLFEEECLAYFDDMPAWLNSGEVLDVLEDWLKKSKPIKYAEWRIHNWGTEMKLTDRIWSAVDFILKEQE